MSKTYSQKMQEELEPITQWEDEGGATHPDNEFYDALREYWTDRSLRRRTFKKGGRTYVDSLNPHHDYKGWFYNMCDKKMYRWNDFIDIFAKKGKTNLWYGIDEEDIEDEL